MLKVEFFTLVQISKKDALNSTIHIKRSCSGGVVWHFFLGLSQSEKFSESKQPLDEVTWKLHDERPSYGL